MSGIVFFATADRGTVVEFYRERLGFDAWLVQDGCTVLRHDNLLVGFCDGEEPETDGIVTLFYDDRETVDARFEDLADVARDEPVVNEQYDIYQFFGDDPEGRTLEFQAFLHEVPVVTG